MNQVKRVSLNLVGRSIKLLGMLFVTACTAAEPSFRQEEVTHILESSYNPETQEVQFQVGHSAGCGTYYNYDYNVLETDPIEKWAAIQIIVRTDNVCEAYLMQDILMDLPSLPFPLQELRFDQNGTLKTLVLQ